MAKADAANENGRSVIEKLLRKESIYFRAKQRKLSQLLHEADPAELRALSLADKLKALRELAVDGAYFSREELEMDRQVKLSPEIVDNLKSMSKLYAAIMDDPAARSEIGAAYQRGEQIGVALANDEAVREARENWLELSTDERRSHVRSMVEAISGVLGLQEPPQVAFHNVPNESWAGVYDPNEHKMAYNERPELFAHYDEMLNTTVHELTHARHTLLADAVVETPRQFSKEERIWGEIIALNNGSDGPPRYLPAAVDQLAYRAQPMEAEAFATGDSASHWFGRTLMAAPAPEPALGHQQDAASHPHAPANDSAAPASGSNRPAPRSPARRGVTGKA